eukprot:CAMPEP_0113418272 /NCGR_PEP_ID=MMETSP0013_2-20120614/26118_1 /TAXON_ID=2843 ORGANISM="Skeletonema costatum, Strain 1716" /NCGR_SAMPLE_ID=MMETSP0013_2 /ASSEMBLY_ACC=CAM_ASM_000158 /LENGTH=488 /DNA_ID=CAMNT_0000305497 /DNA_START=109 /DNA_END=1576 /DNA_ORIENTATION=- /assembly_acc=CAM_ASM_000158
MATKPGKDEHYSRPDFDISEFEEKWDELLHKYPTKDGADPPKFLDQININSLIISLGKSMHGVVTNRKDDKKIPYEVALASYFTNFLQTKIDLSNPAMIKDFALLFMSTVRDYAVKYKRFTNASLGEIDEALYNADVPKLILFLTAFFTKSCLMSGNNPDNPINHIDHKNHTVAYQSDKIIRNAIQCIIDKELTDESFQEIMGHIAFADVHTRGGTVGEGNSFPEYYEEVNSDPPLSSFCKEYENEWKLKTALMMEKRRITSCNPVLVDMMIGIISFSLYAAFVHANEQKIYINLSSDRTKMIFQPNSDGIYTFGVHFSSSVVSISLAPHPTYTEKNLTNTGRTSEHMEQLDRGISEVLKPLVGVSIRVLDGDKEREMVFPGGESDFFQRLYHLRIYGDEEGNYDIDFKRLEEGKQELKEAKEKLKAKEAEVREINKKKREARKEVSFYEQQNKKKKEQNNKKKKDEAEDRKLSEKKEEAKEELDCFF